MRRVAFAATRGLCSRGLSTSVVLLQLKGRKTDKKFVLNADRPWEQFDVAAANDRGVDGADAELSSNAEETPVSIRDSSVIELGEEEMAMRTATMYAHYKPAVYAFTMFDSVDVFLLMSKLGLVPAKQVETHVGRYFFNPVDVLRNSALVVDAMGADRWGPLAESLEQLLDEYAPVSPLANVVRELRLPADKWLPLARWIASEGCEGDFAAVLAPFALSLANGRGPDDLQLPNKQKERVNAVARVLMGAAKEYGRVKLAQLSLELVRHSGSAVTFRDQRDAMVAFGRASRRSLDWQLRSSGAIKQAVADWITSYLPVVMRDQRAAELRRKQGQPESHTLSDAVVPNPGDVSKTGGDDDDDDMPDLDSLTADELAAEQATEDHDSSNLLSAAETRSRVASFFSPSQRETQFERDFASARFDGPMGIDDAAAFASKGKGRSGRSAVEA